jgi:hypothetical protein
VIALLSDEMENECRCLHVIASRGDITMQKSGIQTSASLKQQANSGSYFQDFPETAEIAAKVPTNMGPYQFVVKPSRPTKGAVMEVDHQGARIISAHLPTPFARGQILSASMNVRGSEYLFLAARSVSKLISNSKCWFGIFRADGKKIYATVLEQQVDLVKAHDDGVSLCFLNGDTMRMRLM